MRDRGVRLQCFSGPEEQPLSPDENHPNGEDAERHPSPASEGVPPEPASSRADGEDFASMLEQSLRSAPSQRRSIEQGQSVEGVIVALGKDVAFVDIGAKGEATMSIEELRNEDGELKVGVGDRVKALIVSTGATLEISRKLALGAAAREQIEAAFRAGLPVDGRVEKLNRGGYEVRLSGLRAFCPFSQIDIDRSADPESHVGRVYTFRILEIKEGGRDLLVSRRAILEEEQQEKAREVMRTVVPGAVLPGRVASVTKFGAFVDLGGGVQGLLHVSEMGWSRVSSPSEIVESGQSLMVEVVKVDEEGRRISLSLKHLQADPWLKVGAAYRVGETRQGRVTRLADFGAFVELEPGIEALAHISTFPPIKGDWKALVPPGTAASFRIESIDMQGRKIGVALKDHGGDEGAAPSSGGDPAAGDGKGLGSMADQLRAAMNPDKRR